MGTATFGYSGGPMVTFRVDPDSISWSFQVVTNVTETIGGRVIQVIGSYLDDMTIVGSFGQDHSTAQGESWRQAEAFLATMQSIMEAQAADSNQQQQMSPPAIFSYPPLNYRFQAYVKDFSDADSPGTSIRMTAGKFNQRWQLTLFLVQDASEKLIKAGESNGVISKQAAAAIDAFMARISDGVGWSYSQYTSVSPGPAATAPARPAPAPSKPVAPAAPAKPPPITVIPPGTNLTGG